MEVLNDLEEIYDDPDRIQNHRRQYVALRQGSERFATFYGEFRRLSSCLGYGDDLTR